MKQEREDRPGIGVDAEGNSAVDPTDNVLSLVEAAVKRLDDLREAESRRVNELRESESRRIDEQAALRAVFAERLDAAEAKRIDAIRAVDVNAVAVASQRASDQATVLATQVAQSAEALRNLVATTAATVAASQQQLATTLTTRLTTLEQGSYQQQGRSTRDDPAMVQLMDEMRALRAAQQASGGERRGGQQVWGMLAAIIGALIGVGGLIIAIVSRKSP
jgi:hypothetical protein